MKAIKIKLPKPLPNPLKNFSNNDLDTMIHFKLVDKDGVEWYQQKEVDGKKVAVPFTAKISRF